MKFFTTLFAQIIPILGFQKASHYSKSIKSMYVALELSYSKLRINALEAGLASVGDNPQAPSEPIEEFLATVDSNAKSVFDMMELDEVTVENQLTSVLNGLQIPEKQKIIDLDLEHRPKLNDDKMAIEARRADTIGQEEKIASLDQEVNLYDGARIRALERLGGTPPIKGIMDKLLPLLVIIGAMIGIEESIISFVFEALKFENHVGFMLAFALAGVLGYSAHLAGAGLGIGNKAEASKGIALGLLTITLITIARFAGTNELSIRNHVPPSHFQDFFFMGINIVLWLTAMFLESIRHRRLAYFEAIKGRDNAIDERAKLQALVIKTNNLNDLEANNADERYKSGLVTQVKKNNVALTTKAVELEAKKHSLSTEKDLFTKGVEAYKEKAKKGYFESFEKGVKNRRPKILVFRKATAIFLCLAIAIGTGCQSIEEKLEGKPSHVAVRVLVDISTEPSEQGKVNTQKLADFISNDLAGLGAEKAPRTKVDVRFQEVGELAITSEETIASLEEGEPKFSRVELDRVDSILAFRQRLQKGLEARLEQGSGQPTSEINHCVCRALNRLSESSATTKTVLLFSDLLQNDDKVSFYETDIEELTEEGYQSIAAAFHKACPLNDLTGIEVIVFQTPTVTSQKLVLAAQPIWRRYLESHGAKVSFRPNF